SRRHLSGVCTIRRSDCPADNLGEASLASSSLSGQTVLASPLRRTRTHMKPVALGPLGGSVCALAIAVRGLTAQGPPPATFRAGVDLVELDVSALDKDRRPVHGLRAEDFVVTIDGRPASIAAFKEVDVAPPAVGPLPAPWMRD